MASKTKTKSGPRGEGIPFRGLLLSGHKGITAVEVPFDPREEWRSAPVPLYRGRRGHPVFGRLNGRPFESAIVGRMRRFFVVVDARLAREAGLRVGDAADIVVWPAEPASEKAGRTSPARRAARGGGLSARKGRAGA